MKQLTTVVVVTLLFATLSLATISLKVKLILKIFLESSLIALAFEVLGQASGFPFGDYSYTSALQPQLFSVPAIIPLAWFAMALPAVAISRRLVTKRPLRALVTGLLLAAWDLLLDPQMIDNGFWVWHTEGPWHGVPVVNFIGWIFVGAVLFLYIDWRTQSKDPGPWLMLPYIWMGFISGFGFLLPFVFDNPGIGAAGGLAMLVPSLIAFKRSSGTWLQSQ